MGHPAISNEGSEVRGGRSLTAVCLEEVWTCTKCGFAGPGPTCFGWRNVPSARGPQRLRQPQCRRCRNEASKRARAKRRLAARRAKSSAKAWETRRRRQFASAAAMVGAAK